MSEQLFEKSQKDGSDRSEELHDVGAVATTA